MYRTVGEIIEKHKSKVADIEVYKYIGGGTPHFHTDYISWVDTEEVIDAEVVSYEVMDEEEYNKTILANACPHADFKEWYDNKDAHVLTVLI